MGNIIVSLRLSVKLSEVCICPSYLVWQIAADGFNNVIPKGYIIVFSNILYHEYPAEYQFAGTDLAPDFPLMMPQAVEHCWLEFWSLSPAYAGITPTVLSVMVNAKLVPALAAACNSNPRYPACVVVAAGLPDKLIVAMVPNGFTKFVLDSEVTTVEPAANNAMLATAAAASVHPDTICVAVVVELPEPSVANWTVMSSPLTLTLNVLLLPPVSIVSVGIVVWFSSGVTEVK